MLTIVHTYSRFRSSEVKCYVNGELVSGGDLTMAQMNEVKRVVFATVDIIVFHYPRYLK